MVERSSTFSLPERADPFSLQAGAIDPVAVAAGPVDLGIDPTAFQPAPADLPSGNLFQAGLAHGTNASIAGTLDYMALNTDNEPVRARLETLSEMFQKKADRHLTNPKVQEAFSKPFSKNIVPQTTFNVASTLPLFGTALGTTFATAGLGAPASVAAVTGASTFFPTSFSGFYNEAIANGMEDKRASNFATIAGLGEVALENFAFSGFLKGGSALRQIMRGFVREGIIEEGGQNTLSNALKIIGFKGTDDFANDLFEGTAAAMVAGGVLGGAGGGVSFTGQKIGILPRSEEDIRADVDNFVQKKKRELRREGRKLGMTDKELDENDVLVDNAVSKLITKINREDFAESTLAFLDEDIAKRTGLVEVTAGKHTYDRINLVNEFDPDTRELGRELSIRMLEERGLNVKDVPKTLRDLLQVGIMEDISEGFFGDPLFENNQLYLDELLDEKNVFVQGVGKEGASESLKVWNPVHGEVTIKELANKLKTVEATGLRNFSLLPNDTQIFFTTPTRPDFTKLGTHGLTGEVRRVLEQEYRKSKSKEVRRIEVTQETKSKLQRTADLFAADENQSEEQIQAQLTEFFNSNPADTGVVPPEDRPPTVEQVTEAIADKIAPKDEGKVTPNDISPAKTEEQKDAEVINEPLRSNVLLTRSEYQEQLRVLREVVARNPERVDAKQKLDEMETAFDRDYPPTPNEEMRQEVYGAETREDTETTEYAYSQDEKDIDEIFNDDRQTETKTLSKYSSLTTDAEKATVGEYANIIIELENVVKALIRIPGFSKADPSKGSLSFEAVVKMVDKGELDGRVLERIFNKAKDPATLRRNFDGETVGTTETVEDIRRRVIQQSNVTSEEILKDTVTQLKNLREIADADTQALINKVIVRVENRKVFDKSVLQGVAQKLRFAGFRDQVGEILENAEERSRFIQVREIEFNEIMTEYHRLGDEQLAKLPRRLRNKVKSWSKEDILNWLRDEEIQNERLVDELRSLNQRVADGERPVTLTFNQPVVVTDVSGKRQVLKGMFEFVAMVPKAEGKILVRDGKKFTLSQEEVARMMSQSSKEMLQDISDTISQKHWANRCGSACAGGTGEPRSTFHGKPEGKPTPTQQWNYQQNKIQEGTYTDVEVDPDNPRPFTMKSFLSMTGITNNISALKENLRRNISPNDKPEARQHLIDDQIVQYLYGDKRFQRYAQEIASLNMRPTFERVFGIAGEISAMMPKNEGQPNKQDQQKIFQAISKIMFFAGQEIYSNEGDTRHFSLTEIGNGGIHEDSFDPTEPQQEAVAYVESMMLAHRTFNIEFTDDDKNRWRASRDRLSFYNLLGKLPRGEEIQAALVYNKAEIETPLLNRALDVGLFKGADMWANIDRGFTHRVFDKEGEQKELSIGRPFAAVNSTDVPAAKYRTNEEFSLAASRQGLVPIDNYFNSQVEYFRDYETYIAQVDSIQMMKGLLANNQAVIQGFEDNAQVNDLIASTKMVEYASSDVIRKIAEVTGLKPQNVLKQLDFVNDPTTPGFAEWSEGSFKQPYLFAPFKRAKDTIFKRPSKDNPVSKVNQILTFAKRIVTVNPFDASALFMTPVFLNYSFAELATVLPTTFVKSITETPMLAKRLFKGEALPSFEDEVETYPNWDLFVRHGFTAYSYQSSMESLWDKTQTADYRELQTHGQNVAELVSSVGGLNTAIFQRYIGHNLYNVTQKWYEKFIDKGMSPDRAAQLAVKFVNDTSFMLNPDIFGDEGPILVTTLFTRNLTVGFMRLIAGAAFPFAKAVGAEQFYTVRSGGLGKLTNAITHADTSLTDLAFLGRYYQIHVLKTLAAGMLFTSMAQFALSFLDDDERDEHGEVGDGDFDKKKRFTFLNERGKRSQIRLPIANRRGQRAYWSPQIFREAIHMQQLLGDWGSKTIPDSMSSWFTNRLSIATVPIFLAFNRDYFGDPIRNKDLNLELQTEQVKNFLIESGTPLGFRQEERETTGDPTIDVPLLAAELFGLNKRMGVSTDAFTTVEQINQLKSDAAIAEFLREEVDLQFLDEQQLVDLAIRRPFLRSKVKAERDRRSRGGVSQVKKLRSKARIGAAYRGKEREVAREIKQLTK
jgi:hypothetical protein